MFRKKRWRTDHVLRWGILLGLACACSKVAPLSELYRETLAAQRRGNFAQVRTTIEKEGSRWRNDPNSEWYWRFRLLEAEVAFNEGHSEDARKLLSIAVPPIAAHDELEAKRKVQLANLLVRGAKYDEAKDLLDQAAAIAPAADRSLQIQIDLVRYAWVLKRQDSEAAEALLHKTYNKAMDLGDPYYQMIVQNNFGFSRLQEFRYDEAIPWYTEAIAAAERSGVTRVQGTALNSLGICYYRIGDFDKARELQNRAAEIQSRAGLRPSLQMTLGEIGNTHMLQGNPNEAIVYYRKALAIARDVQHQRGLALWSANLARAYAEVGDWDSAELTNKELAALSASAKDPGLDAQAQINSALIAAARNRPQEAMKIYRQVLASFVKEPAVVWEARAGLGDVYRNLKDTARASEQYEGALRVIEQTRAGLLADDYKISFLNGLIGFYRAYVDMLVEQKQDVKALEVVESSRARIFAEKMGVDSRARPVRRDYRRLARALDATLLSYWLGPSHSFLWVVTRNETRLFVLPPEGEIRSLVTSHNKAILDGRDPLGQPAGASLSRALLGPASPYIRPESRVILVPDGVLHQLNFETLPVSGHYWIEQAVLAISPTLNYLNDAEEAVSPEAGILLIGDPDYRPADGSRLLHASQELEAIRNAFPARNVAAYTGALAQPAALRKAAPGNYSVIHFAAHAVANADSPLDSAIVLAPDRDGRPKLYARDVLDMKLHADLVTLSACRSAGARVYSGEGLVGLAWAFLHAGARNVVGGLWDVSDSSTARLMEVFYTELARGKVPADALRFAKQSLLNSNTVYRRPFYWAPFQIYVRVRPWPASPMIARKQRAGGMF
jgi:CHAT domain-containing protein/Tfp pilus assembly protein PilF